MNSKLVYKGKAPIHYLSDSWVTGKAKSIEALYADLGSRCKLTDKPDKTFVQWLLDRYLKSVGADWKLYIDESDFVAAIDGANTNSDVINAQVESDDTVEEAMPLTEAEVAFIEGKTEAVEEQAEKESGVIKVEASSVEVSESDSEAIEKLKKMRHSSVVGTVQREAPVSLEQVGNKVDVVKNMPKPGTQVLSGDDLDKAKLLNVSKEKKPAIVLDISEFDQEAETKPAIARKQRTAKEEQKIVDDKLANVAQTLRVISKDTIATAEGDSTIISGDLMQNSSETSHKPVENSKAVTNKHFVAYPTSGTQLKEITAEDIVNNRDEREAKKLVSACKSSRTLRIARNACYNRGKSNLVKEIDKKLSTMPGKSI